MIAIDMKMPESCIKCRFSQGDYGFCHAMPENFCGYVYQIEDEGRPNWCPLRQVDKLMVEHVFQQEDFEKYGKDVIKTYLIFETGKKIGEKIVSDMMCEWESKPVDQQFVPSGAHIRTIVYVLRPDINKECPI